MFSHDHTHYVTSHVEKLSHTVVNTYTVQKSKAANVKLARHNAFCIYSPLHTIFSTLVILHFLFCISAFCRCPCGPTLKAEFNLFCKLFHNMVYDNGFHDLTKSQVLNLLSL